MCRRRPWLLLLLSLTIPAAARMSFADDRREILADLQDVDARVATAAEIAYHGHSIEWQKYSLEELQEIEERIKTAKTLARFGHIVDWQEYTLEELMDRNARVWMAHQLASKYLHQVDWREYSPAEMELTERRIKLARFMASYYGEPVDWKDHDIAALQDIRSRIILANNLARRGQTVDWRNLALPANIYEGLAPEDIELVQFVSLRSSSSDERTLALLERSLTTLQNEGIEIDQSLLIHGFAQIYQRIHAGTNVPLPGVLAAYITHRRNNTTHIVAVQNVIREFPRAPIVFATKGDTSVQYAIEYREQSIGRRTDAKHYVVWGTLTNLGSNEFVLPALDAAQPGGNEAGLLLLVDQTGQRYSPIPHRRTVDPERILQPGFSTDFRYYFEVPIDSVAAEFIARDLDQMKIQFGNESEIRVPAK